MKSRLSMNDVQKLDAGFRPIVGEGTAVYKPRVAVLMTSFNRRKKTLESIGALFVAAEACGVQVEVFLVDDDSRDGTASSIERFFPDVKLIPGSGDLFWCRGMHKAFGVAQLADYDQYLWLNDDTVLFPDALDRLLACEAGLTVERNVPLIVVGSTVDESTGNLTYGGDIRVSKWRPLRFKRAAPDLAPVRCDSMNGNIVLVSRAAAARVGNLDPAFEHAMGDTDYALRAGKVGVEVWAAPGRHGICSHNPIEGTFVDGRASLRQRWKNVTSRKGLPWRSWLRMARRHGGVLWPLLFIWPYISVVIGRYGSK